MIANRVSQRKPTVERIRQLLDYDPGLLGVNKRWGHWRATIQVKGKQVRLGWFDSPEEAHAAYLAAKRVHHEGNTL